MPKAVAPLVPLFVAALAFSGAFFLNPSPVQAQIPTCWERYGPQTNNADTNDDGNYDPTRLNQCLSDEGQSLTNEQQDILDDAVNQTPEQTQNDNPSNTSGSDQALRNLCVEAGIPTSICEPGGECYDGLGATGSAQSCVIEEAEDRGLSVDDITNNQENAQNDDDGTDSGCDAGPVMTWLVCDLLIGGTQAFNELLTNVLQVLLESDPLGETGSGNTIFQAWSYVRNATIGLLFLGGIVLVFGQTLGLDAYTIKRSLPRVIFATIGTLLSFYIAAVLIDIGNVLGRGSADLLLSAVGQTDGAEITMDFSLLQSALILTGVGIAVWVALGALSAATALVLAGLLFSLLLRQVAIVGLVIISPIALALTILPGTEKYARMWFDMFIKLLLVYPIVMIALVAGQILAIITGAAAGN